MEIGIEAIEFYSPRCYVDQSDLGNFHLIQKNITEPQKENIPRD